MGATYAEVTIKPLTGNGKSFKARFLVDTGATDSAAPADELRRLGVKRAGRRKYELADGRTAEFDYGLVKLRVMGTTIAGLITFAPKGSEPILGLTALESAVLRVNPITQQLEKLPASMLK